MKEEFRKVGGGNIGQNIQRDVHKLLKLITF
jgi:hypothetical protein